MKSLLQIWENKDERWHYLIIAYATILATILAVTIRPGPYVNDEVGYLLMVDAVDHGSFRIENNITDHYSMEKIVHATRQCDKMLCGIPPPTYPIIVEPFYRLSGIKGLILMNTASFACAIILVYLISVELINDKKTAAYSAVFYSLFTYSMTFSIEIWPHMLSLTLIIASFYLALSHKAPFIAGFLSGLAIAVRYPNALLAGLFLIYSLVKNGKPYAIRFAAGVAVVVLAIAILNQSLLGQLTDTGYTVDGGGGILNPAQSEPYLMILIATATSTYLLGSRISGGKTAIKATIIATVLVSVIAYTQDSSFTSRLWDSIRIVFAEIVDMQSHPAGNISPLKKSILQASPILIMAIFAISQLNNEIRKIDLTMFFAPVAVMSAFYSYFHYMHGGVTPFMRYLLEAIPFLSIVAAYAIKEIGNVKINYLTVITFSVSLIMFLGLQLGSWGGDAFKGYVRYTPIAISSALLIAGFTRQHDKASVILSLAIIAAAAYGLSTNIYDTITSEVIRETYIQTASEMDYVKSNSVIMYYGLDYASMGLIRIDRYVTLIDVKMDNLTDAPNLLKQYYVDETPVYIYDTNNTQMRRFIDSNITMYNHSIIEHRSARVYKVEKNEPYSLSRKVGA